MRLSSDPTRAEQEIQAVIFYLTTFGYIDGHFDESEKAFVLEYIDTLAAHFVHALHDEADARAEVEAAYVDHFRSIFATVETQIRELLDEPVSEGEHARDFVVARLKTHCFEMFHSFDPARQAGLLDAVDELLMADGVAHFAELQFREELSELLAANLEGDLAMNPTEVVAARLVVEPVRHGDETTHDEPRLAQAEQHYVKRGDSIELTSDLELMAEARRVLAAQRKRGAGRLAGKRSVREFVGQAPFLDEHVYICMPTPEERYELLVLGDLHGCYSVLKAAIVQSEFLAKVDAWRKSPADLPRPMLVLLGDYIDRGFFGLNGVLRAVLQLFLMAPEHVIILRGNHEHFVEHDGDIVGGVTPCEAIDSLKPYVEVDALRAYLDFFEDLPNVMVFDEIFFVHGGIPKDQDLRARYVDLSSLNDPTMRYQMMWSDPVGTDIIPPHLQDQAVRFAFGKRQAWAFLQSIGCTTIIRGHGRVESGFVCNYDEPDLKLFTIFSAGGQTNRDLPDDSGYRTGDAMALTVTWKNGAATISPWVPHYASYNAPERNAFFRDAPSA